MPAPAGSKGLLKPLKFSVEESEELKIAQALWSGRMNPGEVEIRLQRQALETLSVETNSRCPLHCTYCYLNERPAAENVSLESLEKLIFDAVQVGVRRIALVGKEPFYDDRAMRLMESLESHTSREEFEIGCVTNGMLVGRFLDRLGGVHLDYLDISVDAESSVNNQFRGKGSYEGAARAIQHLASFRNITMVIASVLHKFNLARVEPFLAEMQLLGARNFHFGPVLDLTPARLPAGIELQVEDLFYPVMDRLLHVARASSEGQVVVEVPVEYSWQAIASGYFDFRDLQSDASGLLYWQPEPDAPLYYKVYLLPQDCWRWARITADGFYLGALRQVAQPDYRFHATGHIEAADFTTQRSHSFANPGWFTREWQRVIQRVEAMALAGARHG